MNVGDYYQKGRYDVSGSAATRELEGFYRKRLKTIADALQGYSFATVLDAGCGDGEIGRLMKKHMNVRVWGVDISKKGVSLAKQKGLQAKVCDMSKKIPFADAMFDLVISSATIEHVPNPDMFLKEIYRVLKPGGIVLISTPNLTYWFNRILFFIGVYPIFLEASTEAKVGYGKLKRFFYGMQLVGHIHVFTVSALVELMRYHNFSVQRVLGGTVDFVSPSSKFLTWLYRVIDTWMKRFPSLSADILVIGTKPLNAITLHETH